MEKRRRTVYAKAPGVKATAELVIKDFLEVMKTSEVGKYYASDTFMVGDAPMAINVFPNGLRYFCAQTITKQDNFLGLY